MLNLDTGTVCLEGLSLSPTLTLEAFRREFPRERIAGAWPVKTGYTWYYLKETLYPQDDPVSLELCFTPEGRLMSLELHPSATKGEPAWSEEAGQQRKALCDRWLNSYCGVSMPPAEFHTSQLDYPWGTLSTYYDPRSGNSGIVLSYQSRHITDI